MPYNRKLWFEVFDDGDCVASGSRGANNNDALGLLEQLDALGKPTVRVALTLDADKYPVNVYNHGEVHSGRVNGLNMCGRIGSGQQLEHLPECRTLTNVGRAV